MSELKQSTAITINLGPFLDVSDAATYETGLAGSMTVYLSKAGGALTARNSGSAISYDRDGFYRVPLNATDTNTVGPLVVEVSNSATHLAVTKEYQVLTANWYDSKYSTDELNVDVVQVAGSAVSGVADFKATGFSTFDETTDTVTLASGTHTGAVIPTVTTVTGATVTDISTATLGKFITVDTGETVATSGSVAQISAGAAGGAVSVGSMTQAALAQFATVDTGASSGVTGSVVQLANGGVALTAAVVEQACEDGLVDLGWTAALSASLANISTSGSGAHSKVVTVTDAVSAPIQGAEVWVSTDEAGNNRIAGVLTTNTQGQVTFWADAGTYYAWIDAPNYNESNPYTITVP